MLFRTQLLLALLAYNVRHASSTTSSSKDMPQDGRNYMRDVETGTYEAIDPVNFEVCPFAHPACRTADGHPCMGRVNNAVSKDLATEMKKMTRANSEYYIKEELRVSMSRGTAAKKVWERAAAQVASSIGLGPDDFNSVTHWVSTGIAALDQDNWRFDAMETQECVAHPYISALLHLDDRGPPTILFSKTLADARFNDPKAGPANDTAYLSWPKKNAVTWFSGDMLYGVHTRSKNSRVYEPRTSRKAIAHFIFWKHKVDVLDRPKWTEGDKQCWNPPPETLPKRVPVPLVYIDASTEKEFTLHIRLSYKTELDFDLNYRVPGNYKNPLGCLLDKESWKRTCEDGVDKPWVALTSSIKSVIITDNPGQFHGDIWENFEKSDVSEVVINATAWWAGSLR